jgi:hypothetical protein
MKKNNKILYLFFLLLFILILIIYFSNHIKNKKFKIYNCLVYSETRPAKNWILKFNLEDKSVETDFGDKKNTRQFAIDQNDNFVIVTRAQEPFFTRYTVIVIYKNNLEGHGYAYNITAGNKEKFENLKQKQFEKDYMDGKIKDKIQYLILLDAKILSESMIGWVPNPNSHAKFKCK